jgi:hypothetical protein
MRNTKRFLLIIAILAAIAIVVVACGTPAPVEVTREVPVEVTRVVEVTAVPEGPVVEVPYEALWAGSAHAAVDTEPFTHWNEDDPAEVPTSCAKCHAAAGFQDFLGADGSEAGKVDAAVPAVGNPGIVCVACHNDAATALTSVTFPSGEVIENLGPEARCMTCHQGRESKVSVDKQIADFKAEDPDAVVAPITVEGQERRFGFRNIHYFAAGATLYGSQAKGGYEYDGKVYDVKFRHVEGVDTCLGCHNQHSLKVRIEVCQECHEGVTSVEDMKNARMNGSLADYDGDGDVTEGIAGELATLQEALYAQIQAYAKEKAGTGIVYDAAAYPYFFADADGDGAADQGENGAVGYSTWTPRLLRAAYNYQVSVKDPGAFAHNAKYIIELLYDSIEDLGGDVSALARNDPGHFAGDTEPFRHWDAEGAVPSGCSKCHSATGLPQLLKEGANISNPISNGFMCSTCHDVTQFPARYAIASVTFPSGKVVSFGGKDADGNFVADDANLCISCHQGRESKASVDRALAAFKDADKPDSKISFRNIHYFAAGATLFGTDVQGAYEFDGKTYVGQNTEHPLNKCTQCHEVHALTVQTDACAGCHTEVKGVEDLHSIRMSTVDYDGDGNTTEGIFDELSTMRDKLYEVIQAYADKQGTPILYNAAAYPYFFVDKDKDGKPDKNDQGTNIGYNAWTPNLLKSAYNYQYSIKDPGAFAHNPKYIIEIVYDSIASLDKAGVTGMTRP